jgi:ubiquinone/menaquinone biosynthesis C-methylase UbiE
MTSDTAPAGEPMPADLAKIERAYRSPPWWYDLRGFLILTFAYRSTLGAQLRFFGGNLGAEHLEAAVGTGTLFAMVLRWRARRALPPSAITAFDYAPTMLDGARARFADRPEVRLELADVTRLPYADASFDTANVANSIHCFPDPRAGLAELARVVKPGGLIAANVLLHPRGRGPLAWLARRINAWGIAKGILHSPYQREEVLAMARAAGLEPVGDEVRGNCLELVLRRP